MAEKKVLDWDVIKNEYISDGETSFRSLSEKYGISASAIHRRAKEGNWLQKREQFANTTETKTLKKLMEERVKGEAKRLQRLFDARDKLVSKVAQGINKVSPTNTLAIRQLTSSLKELCAMEGITPQTPGIEDELGSGVVILPEVETTLEPPGFEDSFERDVGNDE